MNHTFKAAFSFAQKTNLQLTKKERYKAFIEYFSQHQPEVSTELVYTDPYQLLVAVILSAQCTDKRVNMITPDFFNKYPDVALLAKAKAEDVYELIKSCSYPNNKTKHLIAMARKLVNDFDGVVPPTVDQLQQLSGVGRKTANVIASVVFRQPAMAVDTHVFRVSKRLGLTTNSKTPMDTEKQLVKFIPEQYISKAHHWLILHGRYVCIARKPLCDECKISHFCKYFESNFLKK
jgi:endonuclease III